MKKKQKRLFISYSHVDVEFAIQLDASLLAVNIKTFLDQRDIHVGDSIPEKIYEGIETSSHLVYIISKASIKSQWVMEELSIAKIKEKESKGFKILPILIDYINIPTPVSHLRYADFRDWQDPDKYRSAFLAILAAIGTYPRLLRADELKWYATFRADFKFIHQNLVKISERIFAALSTSQAIGYEHNPHRQIVKWSFRDLGLIDTLERLPSSLLENVDENDESRLAILKKTVNDTIAFIHSSFESSRSYDSVENADALVHRLRIIINMLEEIRSETELNLLASVSTD